MNVIVAGQRIVTAEELTEVAVGFGDDLEPVEFDTAAGQAALADIVAVLADEAATAVDREDLAYYRSLLGARVVQMPCRRRARFPQGVAA